MLKDVSGKWASPRRIAAGGDYVVRAGQPYGSPRFYLLEPESEDGLAQWSFFDGILAAHADFPDRSQSRSRRPFAHTPARN